MTREQKELLYNITSWHVKEFNNRMVDRWTTKNYEFDTECHNTIRKLEAEYIEKYGPLSKWESIDDIWNDMASLYRELKK